MAGSRSSPRSHRYSASSGILARQGSVETPTLSPHNSAVKDSPNSFRLTREEESELLRQAVEARRLKALEAEIMVRKPSSPVLLSVKAKAAGYGDDWEAYQEAIDLGQRARETLVTRNMGLVHYCINDIIGKGKGRLNSLSREDLIQEGAIGLARAVDKWNPAIGGKFSTYAVYWVRAAMLRCVAERDDLLRVPEHVSVAVRKMTAAARRLGMDIDGENLLSSVYSTDASWKEAHAAKALAEEAGLTDGQLVQAMKARDRRTGGGYIAFEDWMQKGRDLSADVVTMTEHVATNPLDLEHLVNTLSKYLRPKEMEALCWRYGLFPEGYQRKQPPQKQQRSKTDYLAKVEAELFCSEQDPQQQLVVGGKWGEAMSFTEVGKHMQVSAEYGRKLCHAALEKLRRAAEEGRLEPALLMSC